MALARFRKKIPFLTLIPDELYHSLDPADWYEPFGAIEQTRCTLEKLFDCFVMTYRECKKDIPMERMLQRRIDEANLGDDTKWEKFFEYGDTLKHLGIYFVPYAKPLKIIPLSEVLRDPCEPPDDYDSEYIGDGVDPDDIPY